MQDWKRVESELAELLPSGSEAERAPAKDETYRRGRSGNDESILKHIADALRRDKMEDS